MSTMFQDVAGTIPVSGPGQPVGFILDKSGRDNHARQATASARPIFRRDADGKDYLHFNGSSQHFQTVIFPNATECSL